MSINFFSNYRQYIKANYLTFLTFKNEFSNSVFPIRLFIQQELYPELLMTNTCCKDEEHYYKFLDRTWHKAWLDHLPLVKKKSGSKLVSRYRTSASLPNFVPSHHLSLFVHRIIFQHSMLKPSRSAM